MFLYCTVLYCTLLLLFSTTVHYSAGSVSTSRSSLVWRTLGHRQLLPGPVEIDQTEFCVNNKDDWQDTLVLMDIEFAVHANWVITANTSYWHWHNFLSCTLRTIYTIFSHSNLFLFLASFISKLNGNNLNCVAKLFASKRPHQATDIRYSFIFIIFFRWTNNVEFPYLQIIYFTILWRYAEQSLNIEDLR